MQTTITEALAELKLVTKKIESKKAFVLANLTRVKQAPDQLGDSAAAMTAEMQAIGDLEARVVALRAAIMTANLAQSITIEGTTLSIFKWLTWRREVSAERLKFLNQVQSTLKMKMDQSHNNPQAGKDNEGKVFLIELVPNLSYPETVQKAQELQAVLDKLDGQLSLKNATIVIEV